MDPTSVSSTPNANPDYDNQVAFDKAYYLHQPPEVRGLMDMDLTDEAGKSTRAAQLAGKGYVIDVPIMVWGWDAYKVMGLRQSFGYTWVPSALQPPPANAPGASASNGAAYDPNSPPAGSIKVSLNPADYPPYDPPAAPAQAPTDLVGLAELPGMYLSVTGDDSPDGTKFTDARGTFLKHVILTPFGPQSYWTPTAS